MFPSRTSDPAQEIGFDPPEEVGAVKLLVSEEVLRRESTFSRVWLLKRISDRSQLGKVLGLAT